VWNWTVQHVDESFGDLRAEHNLARSTVRSYQNALSLFCAYLISGPAHCTRPSTGAWLKR
jgi:hypothetical protein